MMHTTPSSGTSEASHYLLPIYSSRSSNSNNQNQVYSLTPSSLGYSPYSPSSLDGQHSPSFYHSPPTSPISSSQPVNVNLIEHDENQIVDHHEDLKFLEDNRGQHQYSCTGNDYGNDSHHGYNLTFSPTSQQNVHEEEFRVDTSIRSVLRRFSWLKVGSSSDTPKTRHSTGLQTLNLSSLSSVPLAESRKFSVGNTIPSHPNTTFILTSPHSPRTITPSPTTSSEGSTNHYVDHHSNEITTDADVVIETVSRSPSSANQTTISPPPFTRTVSVVVFNSENTAVGSEKKRRDSMASNKKSTERAAISHYASNISNLINNTSFHSTKKQLDKEKKRRGESCSKFCHSFFTTSNILLTVFILQAFVCLLFGVSIMRSGSDRLVVQIREYQLLQIRAFVEERINTFTSKYTTMTSHMMESLKGIAINDNVALLRFFDYAATTFGTDTSLRRMEFYRMDDSFSIVRDFNLKDGTSVVAVNSKSDPTIFSAFTYPKALIYMNNPDGYYASSTDSSYSIYKNYMYGPLLELDEIINNRSSINSLIIKDQDIFCSSLNNAYLNYNTFKWLTIKSIENSSIFLHYPVYINNVYNHSISSPNLKKMYIVNSAQNLNNTYLFGVFSLHFSIDKFYKLLDVQNERFYLQSEYALNASFIMNTRGEILATREDWDKSIKHVPILYDSIMKQGFKKNCEVESETITIPDTVLSAQLSYTCDGHGLDLVLVVGMDTSNSFVTVLLANNSILSFIGAFGLILVSIIIMIVIMRALNTSIERIGKNLYRITKLKQYREGSMKSFNRVITDIFPNTSVNSSIFYEIREIENLVTLLGQGMDALKKFLPEPFVKDIMLSKPLPFNVATKQNLTILFCELVGCDRMADTIEIPLFLEMITEYSSIMCKIIQDHCGIIDRFDGGTAMCLFSFQINTLIPAEQNREVNACHAAMDIIYMMEEFKSKWSIQTGHPIHIEIGINSGEIHYGNFNCTNSRSSYSVLGNNLDVAFALQRFNFSYSTQVLIGEETYLKVKDIFICYFVDLIRFPGYKKKRGMKIFSLECPVRESSDLERKVAMDLERVQEQIMEKNYASALSLCEQVKLFHDRPHVDYLHNRLHHAKQESELATPNENDLFSTIPDFGIDPEEISRFLENNHTTHQI